MRHNRPARQQVLHLKVSDIDSQRMILHVEQGKGDKDRNAMLSPALHGSQHVDKRGARIPRFPSLSVIRRLPVIQCARQQEEEEFGQVSYNP